MRAAPPVNVKCTGGLGWRVVQSALPALASGVLVWWLLALLDQSFAATPLSVAALSAALTAVTTGSVSWCLAKRPGVQLIWDGQRWAADGSHGSLDVMVDLGGWLLLRLRATTARRPYRSRWIAVSARDAGPAWHALRTAVYARPPAEMPSPSPATPAAS